VTPGGSSFPGQHTRPKLGNQHARTTLPSLPAATVWMVADQCSGVRQRQHLIEAGASKRPFAPPH
jgi:hypothetical protein